MFCTSGKAPSVDGDFDIQDIDHHCAVTAAADLHIYLDSQTAKYASDPKAASVIGTTKDTGASSGSTGAARTTTSASEFTVNPCLSRNFPSPLVAPRSLIVGRSVISTASRQGGISGTGTGQRSMTSTGTTRRSGTSTNSAMATMSSPRATNSNGDIHASDTDTQSSHADPTVLVTMLTITLSSICIFVVAIFFAKWVQRRQSSSKAGLPQPYSDTASSHPCSDWIQCGEEHRESLDLGGEVAQPSETREPHTHAAPSTNTGHFHAFPGPPRSLGSSMLAHDENSTLSSHATSQSQPSQMTECGASTHINASAPPQGEDSIGGFRAHTTPNSRDSRALTASYPEISSLGVERAATSHLQPAAEANSSISASSERSVGNAEPRLLRLVLPWALGQRLLAMAAALSPPSHEGTPSIEDGHVSEPPPPYDQLSQRGSQE
ncbi:hypothetical protein ONZ51_g11059 [Trametes cubensis]|uniref:Uncharacterized protein n=1 Tax=Trametes cubensis TaxID=1111947 RepID=A0AAD7TIA0_9APHY|nr:hypothetical protein ONZ51_g11059 [Trametes cubensis]